METPDPVEERLAYQQRYPGTRQYSRQALVRRERKKFALHKRRTQQKKFLKEFRKCAVIAEAARNSKIDRKEHYNWLAKDDWYVREFDEALDKLGDILEGEAIRRAVVGDKMPVGFYKGKPGGYVTKRSDALLKFLLRKKHPEYADKAAAGGGGPLVGNANRVTIVQMPDNGRGDGPPQLEEAIPEAEFTVEEE